MDSAASNLNILRNFAAIVRAGSFSRAAVTLGVAQPVLSRQVQALEEDLGLPLLLRDGRGVHATEAGHLLAAQANELLAAIANTTSQIKAMRDSPGGEVVLGIPPMVGTVLTTPVLQRFRQNYPDVSLRLIEGFSGYILEWLTTGRLDVAVLYNVAKTTALNADPLIEERLSLVGWPQALGKPRGASVTLMEVSRLPLILPTHPHGLRTLVDAALADIGVKKLPQLVLEADGLSAIKRLVEGRVGYTLLSAVAVRLEVEQNRLGVWPIEQPEIKAPIVLAASTQRPSTQITRALTRIVREEAERLIASGEWPA